MTTHRTKSISTKVTEAEYARIAAVASPLTISEWTRSVLMRALHADSLEVTVLAEIIALRAIVVTLHFALSEGRSLSLDELQLVMDRADATKRNKAEERLAGPRPRTDSPSR